MENVVIFGVEQWKIKFLKSIFIISLFCIKNGPVFQDTP